MGSPDDLYRTLRSFGWECGPEFKQRYTTDPWVFNLCNAIERLMAERDSERDRADRNAELVGKHDPTGEDHLRELMAVAAERDEAYAVIADIIAETNVVFTTGALPAVAQLDWEDGTTIYLTAEMAAVITAAMEAGS